MLLRFNRQRLTDSFIGGKELLISITCCRCALDTSNQRFPTHSGTFFEIPRMPSLVFPQIFLLFFFVKKKEGLPAGLLINQFADVSAFLDEDKPVIISRG